MAKTKLVEALEASFREVATQLSHDDIRAQLSDELRDQGCCLCAVFGDDDSGDLIYSDSSGCLKKCSYSMGSTAGKRVTTIDTDAAVDVLPRTVYDEQGDDDDAVTSMESTRFALGLFERFVSKDERSKMSKSDFAGKGTSFPINKPGDVMAAVRSIGRAGDDNHPASTLKSNVKRIAKRKGFPLPKAWSDAEATGNEAAQEREIVGDCIPLREGAVGQDGTAYLKLIAPGWGSSGYYSADVLKRDGPKIFPNGTKNFWNHQTASEEAQRPEGDLRDLASVLTEDARYDDTGPAGPGLYAKANVFPQFREHIDALSKHIGMSIRAMGSAKEGSAEGKKGPIIEKLTRGQSVDYVTTPGAGGKILQLFEAARTAAAQGGDMDVAEIKKLIEAEVAPIKAENAKLRERLAMATDAQDVLREALSSVRLPDAARERITRRCLEAAPIGADGSLDKAKFKTLIEAELKEEGEYLSKLTGGRIVVGMSSGGGAPDKDKLKKVIERHEEELDEAFDDAADLFVIAQGGDSKDDRKRRRKEFREGRAA